MTLLATTTEIPVSPARARRPVAARTLLLLPAALALLAGLAGGLRLLGLPAPVVGERLPDVHGPLLVLGFLGTLVALERAVALGRRTGYAAPALLGAGAVALVSPAPLGVGRGFLVLGAAALVAVYVPLWRRQRDDAVLVQALGAVMAAGAALLWAGGVDVPDLLPWLVGFVVLTIVGERLELARLTLGPGAGRVLVLLAGAYAAAAASALLWPAAGHPLLGVPVLVLVGWLGTHDIARHTVRAHGQPRFAALGMLAGYAWLGLAGALWLGGATGDAAYDAVVHAVFLGFTMSMVMVHAPVILPAVVRRPLPYHPALLAPLALLHGSLVLRLWLGDALGSSLARQVGGALNALALLAFVAVALWSATRAARGREVAA